MRTTNSSDALRSLDREVASAFYGRFQELHEHQKAAIQPLLDGRDLILSSGTGSGKTEAVMAPLVSRYWDPLRRHSGVRLLYIAPTKALANDLEKRLGPPLSALGLRVGVRHGDRDDLLRVEKPCVVVTTPESLEVLLMRRDGALEDVLAVVVDEVHLLYNTQRGLQLAVLLHRLAQESRPHQCAALSATIARPENVAAFLLGSDRAAHVVTLAFPGSRPIDALVRAPATAAEGIRLLHRALDGGNTKMLLFVDSRRAAEEVTAGLVQARVPGTEVFTHYSSLSQELRLEVEQRFATAASAVCVATSTLELGIDIGDIDVVTLWGAPHGVEPFLQRIGRGNRRADKSNVLCLVPPGSDELVLQTLRFAALLDAARRGYLAQRAPHELWGAVVQQCLAIIAAGDGAYVRVTNLLDCFGSLDHVQRATLENVLQDLAEHGFLKAHGFKNRYGAGPELHRLKDLRMLYGNFPLGSQSVELRDGARRLGTVPRTNLLRLDVGACVRFGGSSWRVQKIRPDAVELRPFPGCREPIDFRYGAIGPSADTFTTNLMWEMLHKGELVPGDFGKREYRLLNELGGSVRELCDAAAIPVTAATGGYTYLTFAGGKLNQAICLLAGQEEAAVSDVGITTRRPVDWQAVPESPTQLARAFGVMVGDEREETVFQSLLPHELRLREASEAWLKDTAVTQVLTRLHGGRETPCDLPVLRQARPMQ